MDIDVTSAMKESGERAFALGYAVTGIYRAMEKTRRANAAEVIDGTGWAEAAFDRYKMSGNIKPQQQWATQGLWSDYRRRLGE